MQSFNFKNISQNLVKSLINSNKSFGNKFELSRMIKSNSLLKITKRNMSNYNVDSQESLDDLIRNHSGNQNNQNQNTYNNNGNSYNQNVNKKRSRISFLRDGMIISFYLRKTINTNEPGNKNEGYVFIELKEFTEDFVPNDRNNRDPRFILLKGIALGKILLLNPKAIIDSNKLEKISFNQKFRSFDIQQNSENKYLTTLKVFPKSDNNTQSNQDESNAQMTSQIELNPEDIIILQKFINKCIDELLNF